MTLRAQNPGAQQDAEAAREKLLKAADQLDNIQSNSEATKTVVDGMKATDAKLQADVAQLQTDNAALKQQVADLQTALDAEKAAREKEQKVLIDSVSSMLASSKSAAPAKTTTKKKSPDSGDATAKTTPPLKPPADAATTTPAKTTDTTSAEATSPSTPAAPKEAAPPPIKTQKGYYHVVANGETLTLICTAYREEGVKVTVAQVRKANGLTEKSVLKPGQKLFIPKSGT